MFGKVTTEMVVTVKAGTNDKEKYKGVKELKEFLAEKLIEFEIKTNSESTVRIHVESGGLK